MPSYICMVFARDDKVLRVETFERENDTMAAQDALMLMGCEKGFARL